MSIFRRGGIYWYEFVFSGSRIRESARSKSKTIAREAERQRRRELEEVINRIPKRRRMPLFKIAAEEWILGLSGLADKSVAAYRQYMKTRTIVHPR